MAQSGCAWQGKHSEAHLGPKPQWPDGGQLILPTAYHLPDWPEWHLQLQNCFELQVFANKELFQILLLLMNRHPGLDFKNVSEFSNHF